MSNIYRLNQNSVKSDRVIQVRPIHQNIEAESDQQEEDLHIKHSQELKLQAEDELKKAKEEANRLIEEAHQQIEQQKEQFELQIKEQFEQTKQTGYQEGYEEGQTQANKDFEALLNEVHEIIYATKKDYQLKMLEAEEDIMHIAVKSSEKILAKKLEDSPDLFLDLIKSSLEEVIHQPEVTLHVHPEDYLFIKDFKHELEELFPETHVITIFPNKGLPKFGCQIESPYGLIDSSIDTQLEQLKLHLSELIKGEN